jgi:hypothetical protein
MCYLLSLIVFVCRLIDFLGEISPALRRVDAASLNALKNLSDGGNDVSVRIDAVIQPAADDFVIGWWLHLKGFKHPEERIQEAVNVLPRQKFSTAFASPI